MRTNQSFKPSQGYSTLRLYPWRDGFKESKKQLESNSASIKTVAVTFEESTFLELLHDADAKRLFAAIGTLTALESVIIKVDVSSSLLPLLGPTPPIPALTSLLMGSENNNNNTRLKYLTLIGLPLLGDDLDINGLTEAIRIHRSLHSFVMKKCFFRRRSHLEQIRKALGERQGMLKHCDLLDNTIAKKIPVELYSRMRMFAVLITLIVVVLLVLNRQLQPDTKLLEEKSRIIPRFLQFWTRLRKPNFLQFFARLFKNRKK